MIPRAGRRLSDLELIAADLEVLVARLKIQAKLEGRTA